MAITLSLPEPTDIDDCDLDGVIELASWLTHATTATFTGRGIVRLGLDYVDALMAERTARKVAGDD